MSSPVVVRRPPPPPPRLASLLDPGNQEFRASVTRSNWHYRSGRLKKLLTALEEVQNAGTATAQQITYLHKRLWRWRQKNPGEFSKRGGLFDRLLGDIQARARTLGVALVVPGSETSAPPRVEPVREGGGSSGNAVTFVNRVKRELDDFKEYACGDAFFGATKTGPDTYTGGFSGCINKAKFSEVLGRYREMQKAKTGATTPGDAIVLPNADPEWKATVFRMVYERISKERAGICTTFGKAAAHLLTAGRTTGPGVEVVAYRNHVYVLVNRKGDVEEDSRGIPKIPDSWIREPDVVIVDPWAAALGWECIYYHGVRGYPLSMVKGLTLIAAWPPV
jgi:hypothetical protein